MLKEVPYLKVYQSIPFCIMKEKNKQTKDNIADQVVDKKCKLLISS